MLDAFILKYLTKKGKKIYIIGQISLVIVYVILLFVIFQSPIDTLDDITDLFYIGTIIIVLVWAGICLLFWRKPKEETIDNK